MLHADIVLLNLLLVNNELKLFSVFVDRGGINK